LSARHKNRKTGKNRPSDGQITESQFMHAKRLQGDQIGRIFAHRAAVYFGQYFWKITDAVQIFVILFYIAKIVYSF
jgi:hypothetical protein